MNGVAKFALEKKKVGKKEGSLRENDPHDEIDYDASQYHVPEDSKRESKE